MKRGLLIVALLAAGVAGVLWFASGGDEKKPTTSANAVPPGGRLDPGGNELANLLSTGRRGTWHATYKVTRPTGQPGETETLEVWRAGSKVRQDTLVTSGPEPVRTAGFRNGTRVESCNRVGTGPWQCQKIAVAGLDPDATFGAAIGELGNRTITPRDGVVAGQPARCYAVGGDTTGDVCATPDGIPLFIAREGTSIELVTLDRNVPDSVFNTPPE